MLVGSILGTVIGYVCYRQQYPSLFDTDAAIPLADYPVCSLPMPGDDLFEVKSGSLMPSKANEKWI